MTSPAAPTLRRDPVLLGLAALAVLSTAWYLAGWGSPGAQVVGYRVVQPVLNSGMCLLSLRAARLPGLPGPTRRFWYAMSLAGAAFTIGNGIQAGVALRH